MSTAEGIISDIRSAVVDGNTIYYISLKGTEGYFAVSAASCPQAPLLDEGDKVSIEYAAFSSGTTVSAKDIIEAKSLSLE